MPVGWLEKWNQGSRPSCNLNFKLHEQGPNVPSPCFIYPSRTIVLMLNNNLWNEASDCTLKVWHPKGSQGMVWALQAAPEVVNTASATGMMGRMKGRKCLATSSRTIAEEQ